MTDVFCPFSFVTIITHKKRRLDSQMLLLPGEGMGEGLDAVRPVGVHLGVERSRDLVDEQSDLLHHVAALLHVVHLNRKLNT